LADSERQLKEIQALARIGNWEFDLVNDQIRWSEETFHIFGLEPGAHEPDFADILLSIHPEDAPRFDRAIQRAVTEAESYRLDLRIHCADGKEKHIHAQGSPVCDDKREVVRIIGTVLDITERKYAEEKLFQDATYDALTGLVNRRTVCTALDNAIDTARREKTALSVCLSDVDKFKGINDTYGHAAGDSILIAFGRLLKEGTRSNDIPGRLGGDEFCIVFPKSTAAQAAICIERIRLRLHQKAFEAGSREFAVSATFGIAEWEERMDANELLEAADRALYRAKANGRNCVVAA
jgi:diguanylate cyclase (GGDEF)-like protein/PAS domain S-box-containing protein